MEKMGVHSTKYRGKVCSLYEDYEDENVVRLEIEPAGQPKPKASKGQAVPVPVSRRSENVSKTMASGLNIGDQVEVVTMIRKVK